MRGCGYKGASREMPDHQISRLSPLVTIAAPGFSIPGVRVTLIDRATNFGLLALLMCLLFGLAGMVVAWIIEAALGRRSI